MTLPDETQVSAMAIAAEAARRRGDLAQRSKNFSRWRQAVVRLQTAQTIGGDAQCPNQTPRPRAETGANS